MEDRHILTAKDGTQIELFNWDVGWQWTVIDSPNESLVGMTAFSDVNEHLEKYFTSDIRILDRGTLLFLYDGQKYVFLEFENIFESLVLAGKCDV